MPAPSSPRLRSLRSLGLALGLVCPSGPAVAGAQAEAAAPAIYAFELSVDLPLMLASAVIGGSWLLRGELDGPCASRGCDAAQLPAFDRAVAGRYEPDVRVGSDLGVALVLAGSTGLLLASGDLVDLAIGTEAVLATSAVAVITMYAVRRPRPLAYGESAPLDVRGDGSAALAFPSGHTANAFAATLAAFHALRARHPRSALPYLALGSGLVLSSAVGVTRVVAGDHFPSDVLVGAALGASIGWLVPELHRVAPGLSIGPSGGTGIALSGRFP